MALCYTSKATSSYSDVLSQVDVQDLTLHNSLSLFTSILVGNKLCYKLTFKFTEKKIKPEITTSKTDISVTMAFANL